MNQIDTLEAGRTVDVQINGFGVLWGVELSQCRQFWEHFGGFRQTVDPLDTWSPNAGTGPRTATNERKAHDFQGLLPPHKSGVTLTHNNHKCYYQTAERAIAEDEHYDWESDKAKQIAIDTDEIWTLQWYPETPIGFQSIAAPTLHDLLRIANSERYK